MIRVLRKRHLLIWRLLAIALPIGIISAWLVIPPNVKDHLLQPHSGLELPIVLDSAKDDHFIVRLRTNADHSSLQLEWINRSAITSPSAIIYQAQNATDSIVNAAIIGRIDPRGEYLFPLKMDSINKGHHLIVYDIIHHQVINRINLTQ